MNVFFQWKIIKIILTSSILWPWENNKSKGLSTDNYYLKQIALTKTLEVFKEFYNADITIIYWLKKQAL